MAEQPLSIGRSRFELCTIPAGRAILHLKTWTRAPVSLPVLPLDVRDARLVALGPDEWLMMSDSIDGPGLYDAVAAPARAHGIAAVDLSQGMAGLRLGGVAARDVLSMGCGLDLHVKSFPVGSASRTRFAQLPVVLECTSSGPRYEMHVGASYLPYLQAWIEDAAADL